MQSGISGLSIAHAVRLLIYWEPELTVWKSVSNELHQAFNKLVSSPDQRGLLAGIEKEQLVPLETISSSSAEFSSDLGGLKSLLKDDEAAYVILRRYPDATDGFVAITYVPDTANVRQKMLFASSRLTLVRELGTERFRETLFATTKDDLTAEGFEDHDQHESLYVSYLASK